MMIIERGKDEINSIGGITLAGGLLNSLNHLKELDAMTFCGIKAGHISHSEILKSFTGLQTLGKNDYNDIEIYRNDDFFRDSLNLRRVPSESIMRQRMDIMAKDKRVVKVLGNSNVELLSKVKNFGREKSMFAQYTPIDDGSNFKRR